MPTTSSVPAAGRGASVLRFVLTAIGMIAGVLLIGSVVLPWARVDGLVAVDETTARPHGLFDRPGIDDRAEDVTAEVLGLGTVSDLALTRTRFHPRDPYSTGPDRARPDDVRDAISAHAAPWGPLALAAGVLAVLAAVLPPTPRLRNWGLAGLLLAGAMGVIAAVKSLLGSESDPTARMDYLSGSSKAVSPGTLFVSVSPGTGAVLALGAAIAILVSALVAAHLAAPGRPDGPGR